VPENTFHYWDALLDGLDAGVIVLDRERRVERWNAWMVSASGLDAEDVRGKPLEAVFPQGERRRLTSAVNASLELGVSTLLTHALNPRLFPLKTRAGRELLHDVAVSAFGLRPRSQCLIHVSDVTMAIRRERYLRERQNARYDAVVAGAPDVILTMDENGVIRQANPAAVLQFGYSEQELIGQDTEILFASAEAWAGTWQRVVDDERLRQPVELIAHRKDGSPTYVEVSASRWKSDSHMFVTAILRDVNERHATGLALRESEAQARAAAAALAELNATLEQRVEERSARLLEAEEALRQSHKMEAIGQLTGGIAHDFNNLLQGIVGALNMVQKRVGEGRISDIGRFVKGALASAERASALTHRLLAFSRRQPIDPRPLDINQLIRSIEELLRRSLGEGIRMKVKAADDLWLVRCDANQLENAILNLAINARDAMPEGGTLTLGTCNVTLTEPKSPLRELDAGDYVCLSIGDSGSGMTPEVQARAFDPFYTTKPIGQGTGLGLSMVYGFVRQSDGSVRIDSEMGKGTTIEICLPRFAGELEPDLATATAPAAGHAGLDKVVLVAEDEDIVRLVVVEVLNDLGYRALEAVDGPAALRILKSPQRVDLLITDIGLPEMDGRQVVEKVRAERENLKVLYMTGYAEMAASGDFLQKGMEIISKPFSMDKLANKIREVIESEA
jgi:PAS domain S-box-containing protein